MDRSAWSRNGLHAHDAVQGAVASSHFEKYPWRDGFADARSRSVSAGPVWPNRRALGADSSRSSGIGRPLLDNVDRGLRSSLWLLGRPASRTDADTPDSYLQGLIVGLQDPDKISHAGSIPVFSHIRNLSIGRGLASLPEPHQEISDVSHGVLSINHHVKHQLSGEAPQDWRKPAGTTPPALSRNCRLAGPVPLLSLWMYR